MIDLTNENIDILRYAIVKQACEDYLEIKKKQYVADSIRSDSEKYKKKLDKYYDKIMKFFNSKYYHQLCDIDTSVILMMLNGEFEKWTNNSDEVIKFIRLHREKPRKKQVPA